MKISVKNESLFNIQRQSGVYLLRCIPENRIYIGSTNQNFRARFSNHYKFLSQNKLTNKKLQEDYNFYGVDKFEFEILGIYTEEESVKYEQDFINKLNPYYNVIKACNNSKTNLDRKFSEEHKEKIRQKASLYRHDEKTLDKLALLNKENSAKYLVTHIPTQKTKEFTYSELKTKFTSACLRNSKTGAVYKKIWKIEKLKKQAMSIFLLINNNWSEFTSFEKCDIFLNKWRGFTSKQKLKNVSEICGYKVKYFN